ncbi:MAG: hypothetical protein LIP28_00325 [Deltaproteobacteria bacterium]|nr:hypothetical protein [Deltaproteobacteria bacterium]
MDAKKGALAQGTFVNAFPGAWHDGILPEFTSFAVSIEEQPHPGAIPTRLVNGRYRSR